MKYPFCESSLARWLGLEYRKVALDSVPWDEVAQTNHDFTVKIAEMAGLSGPGMRWAVRPTMWIWHIYAHGSRQAICIV